jgi:hypothetical protein
VALDYSEAVLNNSGLICTSWKLLIIDAAVPPDGLMSATPKAFLEN